MSLKIKKNLKLFHKIVCLLGFEVQKTLLILDSWQSEDIKATT